MEDESFDDRIRSQMKEIYDQFMGMDNTEQTRLTIQARSEEVLRKKLRGGQENLVNEVGIEVWKDPKDSDRCFILPKNFFTALLMRGLPVDGFVGDDEVYEYGGVPYKWEPETRDVVALTE